MPSRVSQKKVAKEAGVHPTTVSLALRNSPRLPEATRARIVALAMRMGYQPDPVLDALNAYRVAGRARPFQGVIAWLDCWATVDPLIFESGIFADTFREARGQCEANGFRLEKFCLGTKGHSSARLSTMLRERGVHGVLVPPMPGGRAHLAFRWEWFSAVTLGFSVARPDLHRVAFDHFANMRTLLREVRRRGHRRIGLIMTRREHLRTDTLRYAAYRLQTEGSPEQPRVADVPPLWADSIGRADIVGWYRSHRPDAILVQNARRVAETLLQAGVDVPREVLVASCSAHENPGFCGMYEDNAHLLRVAVDHLVGMIRRGETGIPDRPLRLLISSPWVDGTLPARSPGP